MISAARRRKRRAAVGSPQVESVHGAARACAQGPSPVRGSKCLPIPLPRRSRRRAARSFSVGSKAPRPRKSSSTASLLRRLRMCARQAEAIYRAILSVLESKGGSFGSVVTETVFLRRSAGQRRASPRGAPADPGRACGTTLGPATTEIEQPPLSERACLEVWRMPSCRTSGPKRFEPIEATPTCGCAECARAHGLRILVGDEIRFHAAALCGPGETAYEQTLGMFGLAEDLLQSGRDGVSRRGANVDPPA